MSDAVRRRLPRRGGPLRRRPPAPASAARTARPRATTRAAHSETSAPPPPPARPAGDSPRAARSSSSGRPSRSTGAPPSTAPCSPAARSASSRDVAVVSGSIAVAGAVRRRGLLLDGRRPGDARRRRSRSAARHRRPPPPAAARRSTRSRSHLFARPGPRRRRAGAAVATWSSAASPPLLARQADCVQFATPRWRPNSPTLNPRRAVFPSQLWDAPPPLPLRRLDRVVIGWGGSRAHRDDLRASSPRSPGSWSATPRSGSRSWAIRRCGRVLDRSRADRVSSPPGGRSAATTVPRAHRHRHRAAVADAVQPLPRRHAVPRVRGARRAGRLRGFEPYRDVVRPGRPATCSATSPSSRPCWNARWPRARCAPPSRRGRRATSPASGSSGARRAPARFYLASPRSGIRLAAPGPRRRSRRRARRRTPRAPTLPRLALPGARRRARSRSCWSRDWAQTGAATDGGAPLLLAAGRLAPQSHLPALLLGDRRDPGGRDRGARPARRR